MFTVHSLFFLFSFLKGREAMSKTRTWTVGDRTLISEQTRQISRNTYKSTAEAQSGMFPEILIIESVF
jgi:hypothetical protein